MPDHSPAADFRRPHLDMSRIPPGWTRGPRDHHRDHRCRCRARSERGSAGLS